MRWCLILVLSACGSSESEALTTSVDTAPELAPWQALFASYGLLQTVAGTGQIPDKAVSGWQEAVGAFRFPRPKSGKAK